MSELDALGRAAALGESVAGAPLRLVGELAAPARGGMQRSVRRAIGIGDERGTVSSDPDESFMAPDGVARRVHGDLAAMLIGGVSALLLQTLHPLAMAGMADHSGYREDPLGRLRRTAQFVGTTTYGTTAQAEAAVAQVLRVHRRVKGIAPDGRPYSAADPELVTFIHVAEISSFLASSQRYGSLTLDRNERDQYYEEMAPIAFDLGAKWAPRTVDEAESYLLRLRPDALRRAAGPPGPGLAVARRGRQAGRARRVLVGGGGGRRRAAGMGPPRAGPLRGPPGRLRGRHPRRHAADAHALGRGALGHAPTGVASGPLRWSGTTRRRSPRPGR